MSMNSKLNAMALREKYVYIRNSLLPHSCLVFRPLETEKASWVSFTAMMTV